MRAITFRILCLVLLLGLSGCGTMYPFDYKIVRAGPVDIGPEWTVIHCPEPIVSTLPEKELWLLLPQPLDVPDYRDQVAVYRKGGERVQIFAEVMDAKGKTYPMSLWLQRGTISQRPRAGTYMRLTGPDLPRTLHINTVRLRSSSPVTLSEVLWTNSRRPGPPLKGL